MISVLYKRTGKYVEISLNAQQFGYKFNVQSDVSEFLDKVRSDLHSFENLVSISNPTIVSNDITYITQCTTESLTSNSSKIRFSNRIDAYFYLIYKIEYLYYSVKKNQLHMFHTNDEADFTQLKNEFLKKLAETFRSSKGTEPILSTKDPKILTCFNISNYLSFIKTIDSNTVDQFFAVYKLLLHSSSTCYEDNLQWKNILSQKHFEIPLSYFVACYSYYKEVFEDFPLKIDVFISLIQKIHPHKRDQKSSLLVYYQLANDLSLNRTEFFQSFQNIFTDGVSKNCYDCEEVAHFLWILRINGPLFKHYLTLYYRHLVRRNDEIWKILFCISEKWELDDTIEKCLAEKILSHVNTISVNEFLSSIAECTKHLEMVKPENIAYYKTILETTFEGRIKDIITYEQSHNRLSDTNLKMLLKTSLELPKTREILLPSTLLIIQRLLFFTKTPTLKVIDRIRTLFDNAKDFDQDPYRTYDPANIIDDRWLRDSLIQIPEELCTWLTNHTYRNLCDNYKNNQWAHFIWSRIMYVSISKSKSGNSNNMLSKLNQWMLDVGHHIFHMDDPFTITLISHLFEIVLKDIKSVESLPHIPYIIEFLLNIRDKKMAGVNIHDLNAFVEIEQHRIQDILLLRSKFKLYRAMFTVSN